MNYILSRGQKGSSDQSLSEEVLSIHSILGFVAINQKARNLYPQVTLHSFFHEFPDQPVEALLCPVRAITRYLEHNNFFPQF